VGKTLADILTRQGMRALIANSRGPKSRAEMAAEQFRRAVGLEKKWFFAVWTGRPCCVAACRLGHAPKSQLAYTTRHYFSRCA
jgi:hypothetical protein